MRRLRTISVCLTPVAAIVLLAACGSTNPAASAPTSSASTAPSTTATVAPATSTTRPTPTSTRAPASTTTTSTGTATGTFTGPPAFTAAVDPIGASDIPSTYRPGCPVGPEQLRMLHLSYWGFDGRAHTGTIVVAASVAIKVVAVFRALYEARFPIRRMQPEDVYGGKDPISMDADNTSGFNCRNAVAPGPPQWSAHAYGTAIDVNPVENPYLEGGAVQPAAGAAFVDRHDVRSGMAEPGGVLNQAFAAVGWQWGGRWTASPDYQHFSANGG